MPRARVRSASVLPAATGRSRSWRTARSSDRRRRARRGSSRRCPPLAFSRASRILQPRQRRARGRPRAPRRESAPRRCSCSTRCRDTDRSSRPRRAPAPRRPAAACRRCVPQFASPMTLAWLICVGRPPLLADRDRLVARCRAASPRRRADATCACRRSGRPPSPARSTSSVGVKVPGHVEEAGAQAERAVLHPCSTSADHLLRSPRGVALRLTSPITAIPHRALADEAADVDRRSCSALELRQERRERQRRRAVGSFHHRRHALAHVVRRGRHLDDAAARVRVDVDESGRDRRCR